MVGGERHPRTARTVPTVPPRVVDHADPGALLAATVHLTGDLDLLARAETHVRDRAATRSAEAADQMRAGARDALARASGASAAVQPLSDEVLSRLMSVCAGERVPSEYLPLVMEEANFDGSDARRFRWTDRAPDHARRFRVGVIGAGLAGICAGVRLEQAGFEYTILEKNDAIGGTWVENDYPDLRVDVPNHFYSYSFEPNSEWTEHYARRAEIESYIARCADAYGVRPRVRLGVEVQRAAYDEDRHVWSVLIRRGDGASEALEFDALVSAVGMLNRPSVPDLPGMESFAGVHFHSSRWAGDVELAGKRVGVVGTGASAMHIVPAIAPAVGHLTVFQRSRHWVMPNPDYHRAVTPEEQWLIRNLPYYQGWYRFVQFWQASDRMYPAFRVDPAWEGEPRSISPANEKMRRIMTEHVRSELGADNPLVERVLPDYPPLGKRILQDNGWFKTLQRENVHLECEPIERISPRGVITRDGAHHDLDVLVLATGFHANKFLWPMEIVGRDGTVLHDLWGDDPRAYLGITVPRFPNLFCLYGPNTNPVVGSVIFMLECQVTYMMGCLRAMVEGGVSSMECRQDVHDEYNRRVDAEHEHMVWRRPGVHSYYNNGSGRVTTNAPWRLIDYWQMTKKPDLDDFHLRSHAATAGERG